MRCVEKYKQTIKNGFRILRPEVRFGVARRAVLALSLLEEQEKRSTARGYAYQKGNTNTFSNAHTSTHKHAQTQTHLHI